MTPAPEPTDPRHKPPTRFREYHSGETLGSYGIERELSRGGMGVVYIARDNLGRQVAVKTIQLRSSNDEQAKAYFLREARAAAAIQDDHVVPIYGYGESDGIAYIVMPLLAGCSLDARMGNDGPMPMLEATRIGRDVALGLVATHARRILHRDIKPSNIWLDEGTGRAKIFDFGISRQMDSASDRLTGPGGSPGTPGFMAPEQAMGHEVDGRSDLYSLGCTLYQMTTGQLPFHGTPQNRMIEAATRDPIPPKDHRKEIPTTLSKYICQLMSRTPDQRPASAGRVVADLTLVEDWLTRRPAAGVSIVPVGSKNDISVDRPISRPPSTPNVAKLATDPASTPATPASGIRRKTMIIGIALCVATILSGVVATFASRGRLDSSHKSESNGSTNLPIATSLPKLDASTTGSGNPAPALPQNDKSAKTIPLVIKLPYRAGEEKLQEKLDQRVKIGGDVNTLPLRDFLTFLKSEFSLQVMVNEKHFEELGIQSILDSKPGIKEPLTGSTLERFMNHVFPSIHPDLVWFFDEAGVLILDTSSHMPISVECDPNLEYPLLELIETIENQSSYRFIYNEGDNTQKILKSHKLKIPSTKCMALKDYLVQLERRGGCYFSAPLAKRILVTVP